MSWLLYFLFFCSGLSGLIYQVAWVREFGNVFGNTIYSASLVVAVFMVAAFMVALAAVDPHPARVPAKLAPAAG